MNELKIKKETMTSRQRVQKSVSHLEPDRMPIDLGMHYSTGISAFGYWHLREYLGLPVDNVMVPDVKQFLARVDEDILQRFHCDCILLHPGWSSTQCWKPRGKYSFTLPHIAKPRLQEDGTWLLNCKDTELKMPSGGYFFDGGKNQFEDRDEDEVIAVTSKEAERIYKETDYYTALMGFSCFYDQDIEYLCTMLTDPDTILEQNRRALQYQLKKAEKVIKSMGNYIQAVCMAGDLGTQNGPMCNPLLFEELCAPFLKELCTFIHENSDLKIFLHSCGSIKAFLPILIDCGIDIINPVQVSAKDMNPENLKAEFGDKIVFWGGGCDTQNVLNIKTPAEVSENVRQLVKVFKPGGGFVFNQVHNIMGDIPPENIIAMLDTAYEESFY